MACRGTGAGPSWRHKELVYVLALIAKSRPSFRPLLQDRIPGLPPPKHYADLDF